MYHKVNHILWYGPVEVIPEFNYEFSAQALLTGKCSMKYPAIFLFSFFLFFCNGLVASREPGFQAVVEVEEEIYSFVNANNGANPLWCYGNTCIVRYGEEVFASGLETLEGIPPDNNTRWLFFKRDKEGWKLVQKDEKDLTREPSPLTVLANGQLFLSVNPTLEPGIEATGPFAISLAEPRLLRFSASEIEAPYKTIVPVWQEKFRFKETTYRSFVADRTGGDMILFQNESVGENMAVWTYRNAKGDWSRQGNLKYPWGPDYEVPQTIRVCYPAVQLKEREVHLFGVSDIIEPNRTWREYKLQLTGNKWDYDFRRMFYTWSEDISTGKFNQWVEVASREETCGWLFPADLWVARNDLVHVLWTERALDERLREKFFPEAKQSHALNYAILDEGKVIFRAPVMHVEEGESEIVPKAGRFHITPDGRIFIFYSLGHKDNGQHIQATENRIIEVKSNGVFSEPVVLEMKTPLMRFFTATPRSGSAPSQTLDILGMLGNTMRYARIRIDDLK